MKHTPAGFRLSATDLSNHLSCEHLTQLNKLVATKKLSKPDWYDPSLDLLIQRGREHEAAYVRFLSEKGLTIHDLRGQSTFATEAAMQQGADVIVQGQLDHGPWMGYADILIKVPGQSKFGDWAYEVQDTKLAQNTKAETILQLCLYTDLLSTLQGSIPEKMHVVKPGEKFPTETYRYAEFQAYYQKVKATFEGIMTLDEVRTYPDPVVHCSICSWWQHCDKKRHHDDHLSLVAGMRSLHIVELQKQVIDTLEQFAKAESLQRPDRGSADTLHRKQDQAKIQLKGRETKQLLHSLLPPEQGRGLNRLPEPNQGDIYFDIEGDAYYEDGSLEYLLGYAYREDGALVYKKLWASNRLEEKRAFNEFMQFVLLRWQKYPRMYIYHFAPYEPSAIKRMARVHALFEKDVDRLLRGERFIDLHAIVKEAMLASVETYSLKELERFTNFTRNVPLHEASSARKSVEVALESNAFSKVSSETIVIVEGYNEDDCLATEALHGWLEHLRSVSGFALTRPELKTGEANENIQQIDTRSAALYRDLTAGLPEDSATWNDEQKAKWLLAHQLDYFRREDKSAWWEFYRVHDLEPVDLLDERKAVTGLIFVGEMPKGKGDRNPTHRYSFPEQEISLDEGDSLDEVKGKSVGTVKAISLEERFLDIKKTKNSINIHPHSVHVCDVISPGSLETSLMDIAASVDEDGLGRSWPYFAAKDLLMRRLPKMQDGTQGVYLQPEEDIVEGAVRLAMNLNRSYLAIQGPPGAGKTYTGANMILALAQAGKKIGITAVSHKVIRNLALATITLGASRGSSITFVHKVGEKTEQVPDGITEVDKSDKALQGLAKGSVVCGTAWLWAEDNSREALDYLFVDEAGQMSLSQVLAASRSTQNIILLGDPQQLEQPQKGAHPEGSDVAALSYILDGHPTMPEGKGLFLPVTRRLHPALCRFTSEIFYDGKLTSLPGLERQVITGNTPFDGAGLFYTPVYHKGNQNKSMEEVQVIYRIVTELIGHGSYTNMKGETRPLQKKDILIVAPFNAQVSALRERLPGLEIGTVDKFQGQEAPAVIYSMTCSTAEDAPRGMGFLYSPNRLNVATSRAKSICILVASPALLYPDCRTIDQMRWVNALCTFADMARWVTFE